MRVLFAISVLGAGGAERVITMLANEMAGRGHAVTLLTMDEGDRAFFELNPGVNLVALGLIEKSSTWWRRITSNLTRVWTARRAVKAIDPEVVVSFVAEMNVVMLLAGVGLGIPVIASERSDPREYRPGAIWELLRRLTYRRASLIVVQTQTVADWCKREWKLKALATIPNPVYPVTERSVQQQDENMRPYILSVGRLDRPKGVDVLINAFALVAAELPEFDLKIAGDGPQESQLKDLASTAGITSRVTFLGQVHNVPELMQGAFAFVTTSRYEGFPNVLLEALASGTPTIATDCRSGPREILANGEYGLLVPVDDPAAVANAILRLHREPELRRRLRTLAPDAIQPFQLQKILLSWETVLDRTLGL